jgi:hypothetical protein
MTATPPKLERAMLAVLLGPALMFGIATHVFADGARWRAQYFNSNDLSGSSRVERVTEVAFRTSYRAPSRFIQNIKQFSARFETCLKLVEAENVGVQLVADDGARLFINDELVLDNWSTDKRTVGKRVQFAAGTHRLKLEYHQAGKQALLALNMSFAGEVPRAVPARRLKLPSGTGSCDD